MMAMARLDIVGAMLFVAMGLTIWVLSDWVRRNTKPTPAVKIGVKSTYRRPQSSAESIGVLSRRQ